MKKIIILTGLLLLLSGFSVSQVSDTPTIELGTNLTQEQYDKIDFNKWDFNEAWLGEEIIGENDYVLHEYTIIQPSLTVNSYNVKRELDEFIVYGSGWAECVWDSSVENFDYKLQKEKCMQKERERWEAEYKTVKIQEMIDRQGL